MRPDWETIHASLGPGLHMTPYRYCTVLYCTVLCCTVLYCTTLYCDLLHTATSPTAAVTGWWRQTGAPDSLSSPGSPS